MKRNIVKPGRSKLAQSRIDYITFSSPGKIRKLVYDYGYEPPQALTELSDTVKEVIRAEGKKAVIDLVKLHPDRNAILAVEKETEGVIKSESNPSAKTQEKLPDNNVCASCGKAPAVATEDNYCGCNHSYDEDAAFKRGVAEMTLEELKMAYEGVSKKAAAYPQDQSLAKRATEVWNELRQRLAKKDEVKSFWKSNTETIIAIGLAFIAGILVGLSLRPTRTAG